MDDRYKEYLQSDWWAKTRQKVIERAGNKCECCGRPFDLQVHHLSYEHLGFEREYELMCLCRNCHKWIEDQKEEAVPNGLSNKVQQELLKQHKRNLENHTEYKIRPYRTVAQEFVNKYSFRDYSTKSGDLNLTDLKVIQAEFIKFCTHNGYSPDTPCPCMEIQGYFRNRRYEVILNYMENGASAADVKRETKFSHQMIDKVFKKPEQAKNYLEREEQENAKTKWI